MKSREKRFTDRYEADRAVFELEAWRERLVKDLLARFRDPAHASESVMLVIAELDEVDRDWVVSKQLREELPPYPSRTPRR